VEEQSNNIIQVKNVKKVYRMGNEKIYAVDDVSFDIQKGEFCCLLGTSGSGKSTLLNLMAGIEKLSGGQIIIKGKKIHKMNENSLARFRQRYLGFVFQSYNLMNSMTAIENVEFPLVFKRIKTKKRRTMSIEMLKQVGLDNRMNHKPKEMSGGQQQRVGIARAFVAKPEIVFADEPTGNLDTKTAMEVMKLIRTIAKENNQTIVMVTHDKRVAEFADKVINILDGKIQNIEIVNPELKIDGIKNDINNDIEETNKKIIMQDEIKQKEIMQKEIMQEEIKQEEVIQEEAKQEAKQEEAKQDKIQKEKIEQVSI
jgi:putative ABC transport system ATP-binding protein